MNAADLGRIIRTIVHLRPVQIVAQLRHGLLDEGRGAEPIADVPVRGIESAAVPFLDAPAHAHYDGALGFELLRRKRRFEGVVDWDFEGYGPLWLFHLHQFDYARARSVSPAARAELIDDWIDACRDGAGWAPHPISLRLLSWGKLMLTSGALSQTPEEAERMAGSMSQQAEALSKRLETRLQANHLFSNLLSCVFAGLLFEGKRADAWLALEARLRREIEIQVPDDGAHIERSPMYHGLLLENVLDLLNVARAAEMRAPRALVESLEGAAERMLGAHQVWTHPDGEIALLGDSAFEIAHPLRVLERYAESLGVKARLPSTQNALDDSGVYRLASNDLVVIASASAPRPAYQPGHAHCDALSFELSVGTQRVVTDTGVSEYIPGVLRDISRETRSHATIEIDGEEQSEVWSAHRVGGRAKVTVHGFDGKRLDASCESWSRRQTRHRRTFQVSNGTLEIEDRVAGPPLPLRMSLPFAPGLEPKLDPVAGSLHVPLEGGKRLELELPSNVRWSLEQRSYFPRFGEHVDRAADRSPRDYSAPSSERYRPPHCSMVTIFENSPS